MKKHYEKPTSKAMQLEMENGFLAGSVDPQHLVQKDFNIHTDPYEDKSFEWDDIKFE